jgi:hypothetical protein
MQRTGPLKRGTTDEEQGALVPAGDYSSQALRHGDGDAIQRDGSKIRISVPALTQHRPTRFGLPCANCKAYYDSDLAACPICKCAERVLAEQEKSVKETIARRAPRPLGCFVDVDATRPCQPQMQLALHCDEDGERFLLESRLLLCAHADDIDAGRCSLCILDENHNTHSECASICSSCYERLREKLSRTEAALLIDLREAAQILCRAVWADSSPTKPSRTYQSAAQALLNELCHRAGIARLPGAL